MVVVQRPDEIEGVALRIPGIEEDDLVAAGPVVFLVPVQEVAGPEIGIDVADPVQEDVGADETVIDLVHVIHDLGMDILHELVAVGEIVQHLGDLVRHLLVLVQGVVKQGSIFPEGLSLHEVAELLEDVQRQDIHVVAGPLDAFLDGGDLLTHQVFLFARIQVEIEIVEEIPALGILE